MSKFTPTFIFASMVEAAGVLLLVMVARKADGSYRPEIVALSVGLILVGTAVSVVTALKMAAEKKR